MRTAGSSDGAFPAAALGFSDGLRGLQIVLCAPRCQCQGLLGSFSCLGGLCLDRAYALADDTHKGTCRRRQSTLALVGYAYLRRRKLVPPRQIKNGKPP